MKIKHFLLVLVFGLYCTQGWSAIQEYAFEVGAEEERFKTLIAELRCPMCINSNLASSDAPIAANLRAEIYDQVIEGNSDDEIIEFMTLRYGDFINYRPPVNGSTFFLWFGPGLMLLLGFIIVLRMMKNSQGEDTDTTLSATEAKKLEEIFSSREDN